MNRSDNITKIAGALLKAQSQMGNAVKDSKNPFFKSKYADLNSIREAVLPALNANGISVLQPMKIVDGKTVIETLLLHESGEWMSSETPVVVSKLNDAQAEGSGQTYARRYGLQSFLNIGAEDDDGEATMGRSKPAYLKGAEKTHVVLTNETKPAVDLPSGTTSGSLFVGITGTPLPPDVAQSSPLEPLKKSSFKKPGKSSKPVENGASTTEWGS